MDIFLLSMMANSTLASPNDEQNCCNQMMTILWIMPPRKRKSEHALTASVGLGVLLFFV